MRELNVEQGSLGWHKARQGIVTGTTLGRAIGSPKVQQTLMFELVSQMMTEVVYDEVNTKAMERGKELEPVALAKLSDYNSEHYEKAGMLFPDDIDGFGFSPDAIHRNSEGLIIGGAEIKCPDSKKHIEYVVGCVVPKEYRSQVLAPFLCCDLIQWWDFASFDDRNYEIPIFVKRTYRHEIEQEIIEAKEKLINFLKMAKDKHLELTF